MSLFGLHFISTAPRKGSSTLGRNYAPRETLATTVLAGMSNSVEGVGLDGESDVKKRCRKRRNERA